MLKKRSKKLLLHCLLSKINVTKFEEYNVYIRNCISFRRRSDIEGIDSHILILDLMNAGSWRIISFQTKLIKVYLISVFQHGCSSNVHRKNDYQLLDKHQANRIFNFFSNFLVKFMLCHPQRNTILLPMKSVK